MTRHSSDHEPPAAPPGAREWLAEMLRWAVADAERSPKELRSRAVVGHLLGAASLSQQEQLRLMDTVT